VEIETPIKIKTKAMKQKTFYILAIICCMSLFSSAKQSGKNCDDKICCKQNKLKVAKQVQAKPAVKTGFDLSPLQVFVFGM
jgi:hypothetical protein